MKLTGNANHDAKLLGVYGPKPEKRKHNRMRSDVGKARIKIKTIRENFNAYRSHKVPLKAIDHWLCTLCEASGVAAIEPEENALHVVARIRAAHKLRSPACDGGTTHIKLCNRAEAIESRRRVA